MGIRLNIGSGRDIRPDHINIDIGDYGQEIKRDLEKQYLPFNDSTIDEIKAYSFLEHIDNLWFILDECHRVLKKGGKLDILVPNGVSIAPDHKRYFNEKFFKQYITTGPKRYDFTENKWKLDKFKIDVQISAELSPIKKDKAETQNKLNLGCGQLHKPGYLNADIVFPYDIKVDVRHGLPFGFDTFERIEADNLMEHLDNDEFIFLMNECHRTLKDGGQLWIKVPDSLNWPDGAMGDPTHKRFFTPRSFTYFSESSTHANYGRSYGLKTWRQLYLNTDNKFYEWTGTPKI